MTAGPGGGSRQQHGVVEFGVRPAAYCSAAAPCGSAIIKGLHRFHVEQVLAMFQRFTRTAALAAAAAAASSRTFASANQPARRFSFFAASALIGISRFFHSLFSSLLRIATLFSPFLQEQEYLRHHRRTKLCYLPQPCLRKIRPRTRHHLQAITIVHQTAQNALGNHCSQRRRSSAFVSVQRRIRKEQRKSPPRS
jgi:hypothetical protein